MTGLTLVYANTGGLLGQSTVRLGPDGHPACLPEAACQCQQSLCQKTKGIQLMRQHLLQALRDEKQAAGRAALKAIKLAEKYNRKLEEEYALVLSKLGMVSFMSSHSQCSCQCFKPMQC